MIRSSVSVAPLSLCPAAELDEFAQGHIHVRVGITSLQRTVSARNAILRQESNLSIEDDMNGLSGPLVGKELAGIGQVKNGQGERILEHRLHRRMVLRMQIAVERGARKKTSDRDGSACIVRDSSDLRLQ